MYLTMLGTGNATATKCYNTCFVITDTSKAEHQHFLVDGGGGNGLLRQLELAGINWRDIREIFVTHKHTDHLLGIVWMVRMICLNMKRNHYDGEAVIYGHDEVIDIIHKNGGIAVLAHPGVNLKGRENLLESLLKLPFNGIEAFSSYHTAEQAEYYHGAAAFRNILTTCGSDYHGKTKPSVHLGGYATVAGIDLSQIEKVVLAMTGNLSNQ